ncbi:hypothetical protein DdX_16368 [Ditylenchus destructor]|uniref:Antistasin-like domain-containing protein n=1 Tax=Ditylenchus destructor TaxID=166010 RepID=A0AAD4MNP0_9BILA|nr:hypothetical protein DdX_16368 [Ditylenchus destructor]
MSSKLPFLIAALLVVCQVVARRPAVKLPDYGDVCFNEAQCPAGYSCRQICPLCRDCPCYPGHCVVDSRPPVELPGNTDVCLNEDQCPEGYTCVQACPLCIDCPCFPGHCEPKGVETEPAQDHHIG